MIDNNNTNLKDLEKIKEEEEEFRYGSLSCLKNIITDKIKEYKEDEFKDNLLDYIKTYFCVDENSNEEFTFIDFSMLLVENINKKLNGNKKDIGHLNNRTKKKIIINIFRIGRQIETIDTDLSGLSLSILIELYKLLEKYDKIVAGEHVFSY